MKLSQFIKKSVNLKTIRFTNIELTKSSNGTDICKLTLKHPIPKIKASHVDLQMTNATELWFAPSQFKCFNIKRTRKQGTFKVQGFYDISKPSARIVDGTFNITKPMKAWLTDQPFKIKEAQLRQQLVNNTINHLLNQKS